MVGELTAVSLFAGVGGFDLALERQGVKVVASVEIDKKAQDVLRRHFPNSTIFGDVTGVTGEQLISAGFNPKRGIITGGFPCQDLSVAGKRGGLRGDRSGLFWEICRILDETKAENFIIENVPGLLTSNDGADFGIAIQHLVKCGYSISWRVLDSKHFGIPQRRKRIFIVGHRGDNGEFASKVLSIEEGRASHLVQRQQEGEKLAERTSRGNSNNILTFSKVRRAQNVEDYETWVERTYSNTLNLFDNASETRATELFIVDGKIRRLTPMECERLQGFPDDWTSGQADSNRYKQMGNAIAVPVVEWIVKNMVNQIA